MTDFAHLFAVILAGGTGTRLWPRSRRARPKQLLDLFSSRSLLQETFDRVQPLLPPDHVYVITNAEYADAIRAQLPDVPAVNVMGEPNGRGTAPPIGLAALILLERDADAIMFSLHSDHFIRHPAQFRDALRAAADLAAQNCLVTLGVEPTFAETGYGYIECGEDLESVRGLRVRRVNRFTEKPDPATAQQFVESGNYYWNSGIFTWHASVILEEFARYLPEHTRQLRAIYDVRDDAAAFARLWNEMRPETIDVGIMEKSQRVVLIPLDVGWSDIGSWATLHDLLPADANRNVVVGEHVGVNTESSLIYSEGRIIATVGLDNMIVVDAGDVVLVCPKGHAQQVKDIVDELRRRKWDEHL